MTWKQMGVEPVAGCRRIVDMLRQTQQMAGMMAPPPTPETAPAKKNPFSMTSTPKPAPWWKKT